MPVFPGCSKLGIMTVTKILACLSSFILTGCQFGYLLQSATGQMALLNKRVPMEEVLKDPQLSEENIRKLLLSQKAKAFAENDLGLAKTKNYTSFVQLDRPYVTYVVSAAAPWEMKHHLWHFPIIGDVPYKGFFNEDDAKAEEDSLKKEGLDTYRRGVSAYSTLGWFRDPVLSSMLAYKDHDLVNTIIHETVHATLYIKSSADFNERIATFLGNIGAEAFYAAEEGKNSPTVQLIHLENEDEKRFSQFISNEIKDLEAWYKTAIDKNEDVRKARLREIQERFKKHVLPVMKTDSYKKFPEIELNNARLLIYRTYLEDLSDFQAVFAKLGHDFKRFVEKAKELEDEKKPEEKIKEWANQPNL